MDQLSQEIPEKFEILKLGVIISAEKGLEEQFEVIHVIHDVPDIQIGNMAISGKAARRVPTPVMANTTTGEVYVLRNDARRATRPAKVTGFIFPFDERCFVDDKDRVHSAQGFTFAVVNMLRPWSEARTVQVAQVSDDFELVGSECFTVNSGT